MVLVLGICDPLLDKSEPVQFHMSKATHQLSNYLAIASLFDFLHFYMDLEDVTNIYHLEQPPRIHMFFAIDRNVVMMS